MPVERYALSASQLAELLGVDPARFITIERLADRNGCGWFIAVEPEGGLNQQDRRTTYDAFRQTVKQEAEGPVAQTSTVFPQLTKTGKKSGGKKKGC